MAKWQARPESDHPSHPIRNFFYFIYTIINVLAFCLGFFFFSVGQILYTAVCAAVILVAVLVGVIHAMRVRKR